MKKTTLTNLPIKGTSDWFPDDFLIRKYIFDTWREVCTRFGYQEYLTPLLESADMYRAKSGEDVGGKELTIVVDRAGRELAIRPEMTPSVTRMVSRMYTQSPKPLRYFSIANFFRNEKPQRGRNREFWQLNFDIFGTDSLGADIEIIRMAAEILLAFNPPSGAFAIRINSRRLMDEIFSDIIKVAGDAKVQLVRVLDKYGKMSSDAFKTALQEIGLDQSQIALVGKLVSAETEETLITAFPSLQSSRNLSELQTVMRNLQDLGYGAYVFFSPLIFRGFDYYDGIVFEVYDNNPQNTRSMFGGGRYNGLAGLFGGESFPAVGCAPGDETTYLFLRGWGLAENAKRNMRKSFYFPILGDACIPDVQLIAQQLRMMGCVVEEGLEVEQLRKALTYANRTGKAYTIIFGQQEKERQTILLKDMAAGKQEEIPLDRLQSAMQQG